MSKAIYEGKKCKIISVETKWGYLGDDRESRPLNTWFLLNVDGYFVWVNSNECQGIK